MRQQLAAAAWECRSATFERALAQIEEIKALAVEVGSEFSRLTTIEILGDDVAVMFSANAA